MLKDQLYSCKIQFDMFKNFVKNLWKKIQPKKVKNKKFLWLPELPQEQKRFVFGA
jgi:hypothetical protein